MQLIATAASAPTVISQLPRRLAVIACEDIGAGDEILTCFTVACSAVFTPKRSAVEMPSVTCFLTNQMCLVQRRSRIGCSLSLIAESASMGVKLSNLSAADRAVFSAIRKRSEQLEAPDTAWRTWQRTNDWRGERMLRYLELPLPFDLATRSVHLRPAKILHDLPSYCYDLHTRIGRSVIQSLIHGAQGADPLKYFFARHKVCDRATALGMALFYSEGGQLRNEIFFAEVLDLEQRIMAQKFGLNISEWDDLRAHVNEALEAGIVDRLRREELELRGLQMQLLFGSNEIAMKGTSS
ncbi:MAG TPA: hypothetical protein VGU25_07890 [Acidobacteriaceae bacterium]|nr:hypothetical protein [Acidobacteriaceae bacterium]